MIKTEIFNTKLNCVREHVFHKDFAFTILAAYPFDGYVNQTAIGSIMFDFQAGVYNAEITYLNSTVNFYSDYIPALLKMIREYVDEQDYESSHYDDDYYDYAEQDYQYHLDYHAWMQNEIDQKYFY